MVPTKGCRLCGSVLVKRFSLRVLDKYDVGYCECSRCKSLQTEEPFWLAETYNGLLPNLDVGGARRALRTCAVILLASRILSIGWKARLLDFGGGDGFVVRMMKDVGFKAFVYDKYAPNTYACGFSGDPAEQYDIVTAIEVWEHLAEPNEEIDLIFSKRPRAVIVATDRYFGQSQDWPYLGAGQGGHVFFYSKEGMQFIASKFGYDVVLRDSTAIFVRSKMSPLQRLAFSLALRPVGLLFGRLWLQLIRPDRKVNAVPESPLKS